jgi:putative membrane protein
VTQALAYNQGFYNLFLAVGIVAGIALMPSGADVGVALLVFGLGAMGAAATVLITSDRSKARAALAQGLFPGLGLLCLLVWAIA